MDSKDIRNPNREIYEGWTVSQYIRELYPMAEMIKRGESWMKPPTTADAVKKWCMDNQPYYKKNIPEVTEYFVKFFEVK